MITQFGTSLLGRFFLILVLLVMEVGFMPAQRTFAAPITVMDSTSRILYVKGDATGAGNGTSWVDAYTDLQSALSAAVGGDEIWVGAGTYKPTTGDDRSISFNLHNGVALYGGFAGGEASLAQLDPVAHPTILSGDIGVAGDTSDNSFHVVSSNNLNSTALLDGFTIREGAADVNQDDQGGGMYNINSSPTLRNLVFTGNSAGIGTGIYNYNSSPSLSNITFMSNSGIVGSRGGAIVNDFNSNPDLTNVTFMNNSGVSIGGAMLNADNSNPSLVNVTFTGNSASMSGGAIYNWNSSPTLRNVTFSGNSASAGGAIDNDNSSHTTIINSILYGDPGGEISNGSGTTTVTYSIVQGGYPGTGNLDADPFLGPLTNNGGFTRTMAIGANSPAVDAGTNLNCPSSDQRGVPRPQRTHCDIGAYEYEDLTPPTILSIVRADPSPTSASSVSFTVTFSENVMNVGTGDFSLATTGVTGAAIANVTGSGAVYTVSVDTGSSDGTIRLDLVDDDSIRDLANLPLGGVGAGNGSYQTGETYDLTHITISGSVGVAGATLSYSDGSPKTATSDDSGNYSLLVSYGWTGTVAPSRPGYTFAPDSKTYSNLTTNMASENYTTTAITYTISGNAGVAGAVLSYTDGSPKTVTADGSGNYSFSVSYSWSGTVTPSRTGYTFSPASLSYSDVTASRTDQNYTATPITFTISGSAGGGVTLSYTDVSPRTVTTDGSGNYSLSVSYGWSGTVTPSRAGYTFSPASRTYPSVTANKTGENYTAIRIPPPSALFDAWPLYINAGSSTEFHIVSTSNLSTCNWNYGDGSSVGTSCSPYHAHTYTAPGFYTVTLSVTGPGGSNTMTRTRYITVYPTLVVDKTGNGTGTVTSSPAGINCGEDCSGNFNDQTWVTLTANPEPGSNFIGWSGGGCSGTDPCTVFVEAPLSMTAHFEKIVASCPQITAWRGEYWVNASLSGSPVLCRDDANLNFDWDSASPDPSIPLDNFSAQWTRTINFGAGRYQFFVDHDDGARLYIDDMLHPVLDKWGTCCTVDSTNPITFSEGNHVIRMQYYDGGGAANAHLWWVKLNPAVLSITRSNADPTIAPSVQFIVSFSESVTGVDVHDFSLTTAGLAGASIAGVSGSGAARTVTVNTGTGTGTLRLNVVDDDSVQNSLNVPLGGVGAGNGNYTASETYTVTEGVNITIGTQPLLSSPLVSGSTVRMAPPNIVDGPVKVKSSRGANVFTSQRVVMGDSFNEVMGYPTSQLTTEYWFPWYDNRGMTTWILVGNASSTQSAAVDIYIGGVKRGTYTIPVGGRVTPRFNLSTGPVRVVSTNGVRIFTSERAVYNGTFNEVMGYPANQFTTEYWFPWYDNVGMAAWVLVGNPSMTSTARVDIYIGGVKKGTYSIPKGGEITPRFPGVAAGPVRVVSTNKVAIFSSERSLYGDSFNEVMGYPTDQLTTEYWFPWYDNVGMSTWVLVGNPTGSTAKVDIYVGGVKMGSYSIGAGKQIKQRYALNTGPVRVVSTNGVKVFSSERVLYGPSFNEVMGYPGNKLTTEYWFPWYDSTTMTTDILVALP